jgi:hypothetical protein
MASRNAFHGKRASFHGPGGRSTGFKQVLESLGASGGGIQGGGIGGRGFMSTDQTAMCSRPSCDAASRLGENPHDLREVPASSAARFMVTAGFKTPVGALSVPPWPPCLKFAILAPTSARSFSVSWRRWVG